MSCATPVLSSGPFGHVPETAGHIAEIAGHDPETAGHLRPKYAEGYAAHLILEPTGDFYFDESGDYLSDGDSANGAKGYVRGQSGTARRIREASFVPIITPSVVQLQNQLAALHAKPASA